MTIDPLLISEPNPKYLVIRADFLLFKNLTCVQYKQSQRFIAFIQEIFEQIRQDIRFKECLLIIFVMY